MAAAAFSVWTAYATATHYWPLAVANASCLVGAATILVAGTKSGWSLKWVLLATSGAALAALFGWVFPFLLAAIMAGTGVALRVPQFLSVLRSPSVVGVSASTWLLSGVTAACWLVVSLDRGATAVVVANISSLGATCALVIALYWRRRRTSQAV